MTNPAKVMLSELEAMLVSNSEWILTKHRIMGKASDLLSIQVNAINDVFFKLVSDSLPELSSCKPRISKGEHYKGLPYAILDYPALFSKTDVFAIRTMFWWGNFISVTLHLSGAYKKIFEASISNYITNSKEPFYVSTGRQEWEHHFEADNYLAVSSTDEAALYQKIMQPSFIKIALKYDLSEWDNMDSLLKKAYNSIYNLLKY